METRLAVLRARREVLRTPCPIGKNQGAALGVERDWVSDDPFAFETRGFYLAPRRADGSQNQAESDEEDSPAVRRKRKSKKVARTGVVRAGRVSKPEGGETKRRTRFVTNWTEELDEAIRTGLRKWGWGRWRRIATSGLLPTGYSPKMIARRVVEKLGLDPKDYPAPDSAKSPAQK